MLLILGNKQFLADFSTFFFTFTAILMCTLTWLNDKTFVCLAFDSHPNHWFTILYNCYQKRMKSFTHQSLYSYCGSFPLNIYTLLSRGWNSTIFHNSIHNTAYTQRVTQENLVRIQFCISDVCSFWILFCLRLYGEYGDSLHLSCHCT